MALSDLELLELVERAQDERQGPIGPQGVGIRSIEQPTADAVIIALTDGRTKELRLTAGPKGDPGEAGKPGQDGKPGPAGSPGRAGAPGVGVAGAPGRDGTSIDTAIVNADGNLLLGLTDGNVLNVGRVVGPPGATGAAGPTGLPGRAGRDGNTILSGTHAPSDDEGSEGDFWIDTSSPLFDFYGKGSSGWRKLTSLRAPQTNVGGQMTPAAGGGSGGGGGGGAGALQNTATLPLANPTRFKNTRDLPDASGLGVQKDFNEWVYACLLSFDADGSKISVGQIPPMPSEVGMLWFSTNDDELTLFIYVDDQSGWVPAAPPVSLDGINTAIANVDAELMKINANVAMNKSELDEKALDIQLDQDRQDEKIAELEGEVDDLKPTVERGEWIYNSNPDSASTPAPGEYHAYVVVSDDYCKSKLSECLLNAAGQPDEASKCNRNNELCLAEIGNIDTDVPWHDVQWMVVHRNDVEGRQHSFGDVVAGMYLEAINVDGTGHGLYEIDGKSLTGPKCGFQVSPVHSKGHPNGKAVIKIFKMAEAANPEDYVRKDGDSMLGALQIRGYTSDSAPSLGLRPQDSNGSNSDILKVYGTDGSGKFWVTLQGDISASSDWSPTKSRHLATKEYVDSLVFNGPAKLAWRWLGNKSSSATPEDGGFYNNGGYLRFSFKTDNNVDLGLSPFPDTGFLTASYGPIGTIWHYDKSVNKWQLMRQLRIDGFRWNYKDHIEYKLSSSNGRSFDELIIGEIYYVTIGGFF